MAHAFLWAGSVWHVHMQAADGGGPPLRQPSSAEIVGMGALSKLAASVITYPSQVRELPISRWS